MDITGNAFVTGGASGIGKACCIVLAKEGAKGILVADINLKAAEETVAEATAAATNPSFRAEAIHLDVSDEESVKKSVARMIESFGRIDYCVHCAGIGISKSRRLDEATFDDLKRSLAVHVHGTYLITSLISAAMKTQDLAAVDPARPERGGTRGSIVIIGSYSSLFPIRGLAPYTAAKHAVMGIANTAALESAIHNISVNCVCPGWTDTPMLHHTFGVYEGMTTDSLLKTVPINRLCSPYDIADAVLFLCSPRSSYVTGLSYLVDGGMALGMKT
ncbi:NAD(P)-binding protein [Daldinia caldariorum]|uniref:NAD(P)-binding protein n=1 Tax=Daldinia caldariorum TaxID=326644 RepID=UPI0020082899|nr:NAD(P)-binding protein [Daldinia caldariorum]KAI1465804.1 NAD(P)-binding protein [Daldinia caldariorum]